MLPICAKLEQDIAELDGEDRAMFLEEDVYKRQQYGIPCRRICALLLRCLSGASSPYTCKALCCLLSIDVICTYFDG